MNIYIYILSLEINNKILVKFMDKNNILTRYITVYLSNFIQFSQFVVSHAHFHSLLLDTNIVLPLLSFFVFYLSTGSVVVSGPLKFQNPPQHHYEQLSISICHAWSPRSRSRFSLPLFLKFDPILSNTDSAALGFQISLFLGGNFVALLLYILFG